MTYVRKIVGIKRLMEAPVGLIDIQLEGLCFLGVQGRGWGR